MIYFKCNEVGHFSAKYSKRSKFDRNGMEDFKYMKNMDYKDKGKKSCYIVEEDHTNSSSIDDKEIIEMVYIVVNKNPNEEIYKDEQHKTSYTRWRR